MNKTHTHSRRTKIVATLGPASDRPGMLARIIAAGTDVVRLNYSHDQRQRHTERVKHVRRQAGKLGVEVGVMADLQGPKIRIGGFGEGRIELEEGDDFVIDADLKLDSGDENHVGVTYRDLPKDVRAGDTLLIDDGRIILQVERSKGSLIECVVLLGGELTDYKGINREGGGLSAKALTRKDRADLRHAVAAGVDYVAVSFPRNAEDIISARRLIAGAGGSCAVIAKIERAEALDHAEEIVEAADGIMVARGDLGVEIGDARLVPEQKRLVQLARARNRLAIIATQMMQSMIGSHIPTRAEVFDVANAVLDGTDAVMLSAETSVGRYPDKAVEAMARICVGTEQHWRHAGTDYHVGDYFDRIDEAIAVSAVYAANRVGASAIAALTETGATCMWMSRMSAAIPIFAFTGHVQTQRKVTLYRGVYPIAFDLKQTTHEEVNRELVSGLLQRGAIDKGDIVIITKGDVFGRMGGTNAMKIVRAGEVIESVA